MALSITLIKDLGRLIRLLWSVNLLTSKPMR